MLLSLAVRASCSYTALPISPGWPSMITNGCVCVCVTVAAPSEERQGEASRWKNFPARHVVPLFYKYNGIITYLYVTRTVALKKRLMTTVCVCVFAGDQAIWGGCLETVRQHSPHLWKLVHVSPPPVPPHTSPLLPPAELLYSLFFSRWRWKRWWTIRRYFCSASAKLTHLFFLFFFFPSVSCEYCMCVLRRWRTISGCFWEVSDVHETGRALDSRTNECYSVLFMLICLC